MQHLLDFIIEHTLEEQHYLVARCPSGELEMFWRRQEAGDFWLIRPKRCEGPFEHIHRRDVIAHLQARGADLEGFKQELHAMLAAQIAYAELILRNANNQLGRDLVERFALGQRSFIEQLQAAAHGLIASQPRMVVVKGGQAQTAVRTGHLSLVR
ncbi:MAG TPA: hypothetical protein VFG30_22430 [Polyangiales bacterium]|nr:hypothetical protein [Polyangiales bacterium]